MPTDMLCQSRACKVFLELVSCGITDSQPREEYFSQLTADEWESIYTLARRQTVCGICYKAFCRLPDRLLPPDGLLQRWVARVSAIESFNHAMGIAVTELVGLLRAEGLRPVVQKGLSVARFYSSPDLRECGDIDLWLRKDEFRRAIDTVRIVASDLKSHPDGSISFVFRGFIIELHRRLINISNPFTARKIEKYSISRCDRNVNFGSGIPSPTPLLELLLITVHIMRHVFGTGVGLRHVCDYVSASYALSGLYDPIEFKQACSMLGISRWVALLNDFSTEYLQADPTLLPPSGLKRPGAISPSRLMKIIMEGGNFGHHPVSAGLSALPRRRGKFHTMRMILRRSRFAAAIAPREACWNFINLIIGQVH